MKLGIVQVATITVSISLGASPASFTARAPASEAMSTSDVPSSAMRRLWMPTRSRIHWSLVSMRSDRSSLVTTLSGCALPRPVSRAPGVAVGRRRRMVIAALQRVRPMSSTAASRSSGDFTASVAVPLRSRLTRPTSVPAGGSSSTAVTPSSRSVAMQASHRTGRVTCATSRRSDSAPLVSTAPSALDSSGRSGSAGDRPAAWARIASSAGAMNRVWNAPATGSRFTLARSGGAASSASSALTGPAATTWPAPFTFAGSRPSPANAADTSSGLPPSTALIPVGSSAHAAAISRPRTAARATAASADNTPARAVAASSPTEWPAVGASAGSDTFSSSRDAASSAVATISGWVTAVSRISSADASVPSRRRSSEAVSDHAANCCSTAGSSSQGASMPGVCDPWPGASRAITPMTQHCRGAFGG